MEEKIKAPQFEEEHKRRAQRRAAIDDIKAQLAQAQREALDNDPYEQFVYRLPLDVRKDLTAEEISELETAEEIAHNRHAPAAREKAHERRTWVAAGGSEESFERNWSEFGEEAAMMGRSAEAAERYTSAY